LHYCLYFCYQFKYNNLAVFFYNIFLWVFKAGIHLASLFSTKASKWVQGRKGLFEKLARAIPADEKIIWMHCASLGEFEQGRPLLEKMKEKYPDYRFLLTFFSPSGYEVQKNYKGADWVFYLPADGPHNARRFLEIVHPSLVIFVKYEFWYYYLKKIKYRNIPLVLVSALFREDMSFFSWYGGLQRKMLSRFDHLFVQNESSAKLIKGIGLADICSVSGDTRFDRVAAIADRFEPIPLVEEFCQNRPVLVAGSTWPDDETILAGAFHELTGFSLKMIIAPHEIGEKNIQELKKLFPEAIRFSEAKPGTLQKEKVLIIDNIGMLSRLYKYGWLTYIGGGMMKNGVHNVLEAAVYNKIVLFGPFYQKYTEAIGLVKSGGGISFTDEAKDGHALKLLIETLADDEPEYLLRSNAAGDFVKSHRGATDKILHYFQEKRLLTS
jgi:3-deoxy-D-manno-octulosonic-acid transferase